MVKAYAFLVLFLFTAVLSACDIEESFPEEVLIPSPTPPPTPTLAAGLPSPTATTEQSQEMRDSAGIMARPTDLPTVAPTPLPTDTPAPAARLGLGLASLLAEDFDAAVDHFLSGLLSNILNEEERLEALYGLGIAQRERGFDQAATDAFSQMLSSSASAQSESVSDFQSAVAGQARSVPISYGYYHLAKIYEEQGDCEAAVQVYSKFLEANQSYFHHRRDALAAAENYPRSKKINK